MATRITTDVSEKPTVNVLKKKQRAIYSSSLAYGPYSLTSASFRMKAHTDLSSAFFLHLLTPIDFR